MRRYWLSTESFKGDFVEISGDAFHHICEVCRQGLNDQFEVLGMHGKALLVQIIELKKKLARAQILSHRDIAPLSWPHIHLILAWPRPPVFDSILERAVEMGVFSVRPVFSQFSFFREPPQNLNKKKTRWEKIIISATQQCGRSELMKLYEPTKLEQVFEDFNPSDGTVGLFAYEGTCDLSLRDALIKSKSLQPRNVWLFVGSEGGFSRAEVELFKSKGLEPVTMGDQVLRVETACLALVSVIKYEYHLMR